MDQINPGKLADELQSLAQHAEDLLRAAAESTGETAAQAREKAEESLRAIRDRLGSFEREMRVNARAIDGYVRDNPWTAVAIVGGAALIVGMLLARK
jgi:ElaB/YqjD/DUF883 family membrane-anchored ribosome-binding protein